eukprot:UN00156
MKKDGRTASCTFQFIKPTITTTVVNESITATPEQPNAIQNTIASPKQTNTNTTTKNNNTNKNNNTTKATTANNNNNKKQNNNNNNKNTTKKTANTTLRMYSASEKLGNKVSCVEYDEAYYSEDDYDDDYYDDDNY